MQDRENMHTMNSSQSIYRKLSTSVLPFEAFMRFSKKPGIFFLDSAMESEKLGRFSFIGFEPFLVFSSKSDSCTIETGGEKTERGSNPFKELDALLDKYTAAPSDLPVPCFSGAAGYFGYDLCHFVEKLPRTVKDDLDFPDLHLAFYDRFLVYDHIESKWFAGGDNVRILENFDEDIKSWLEHITDILNAGKPEKLSENVTQPKGTELISNFRHADYLSSVQKTKDYIEAGDIFQVNLSQRFEGVTEFKPLELYRRLREVNKAPFAAYFAFEDKAILSSSPERFIKLVGKHVETRPIKGTRPRVNNEEIDITAREELLSSEKDNAELAMIVDLERNDLGRVCEYGSVIVSEARVLEEYPTVYHLVATVEGNLHKDQGIIDLLKATFPGGSITGAPKIRAMEIIDELEPTARGPYTGSIGYIGFNGAMDLNIAIRTMLYKDGKVYLQVGGGIVADSDPTLEYEETLHKARAMFEAVAGITTQ